jgi:hypothetical protein
MAHTMTNNIKMRQKNVLGHFWQNNSSFSDSAKSLKSSNYCLSLTELGESVNFIEKNIYLLDLMNYSIDKN